MTVWLVAALLHQVPFETRGFTRPLALDAPDARACASCHAREANDWRASFHAQSLTSPVFRDGFAVEPHLRCVVCHGPLEAQTRAAWRQKALLASGAALPADSPVHDGITCAACHVRDGTVLAPSPTARPYGHPLRHEPALRTSAFCATCHEFTGHALVDGVTVLNALPTQTTFTEWTQWGGARTCQACHMPNGSHRVRGGHDVEFVRGALTLDWRGDVATVTAHDVGHRVPTGDVFRHLVLWADDVPLARFGVELGPGVDADGHSGVQVTRDTRLVPEVPVRVVMPRGARSVRLTYHFTAPTPRSAALLTRDDELVELFSIRRAESPAAAQRVGYTRAP
ncbi:MAG: hypothetical protein SFW67_24320 [Myxococcaceae bacterium]|nr:hypothetical protein [Myxococcaceae bacterium]